MTPQVGKKLGIYLETVTAAFPEVTWDQAKLIRHGSLHDTVILDERLVFRFPKSEDARARFQWGVRLMQYLAPRLTFAVPSYSYVAPDLSFGGYEFVPGEPVREDERLPETDLADFLSELHAIPTEAARRFHVEDVTPPGAAYLKPAKVAQLAKLAEVEMTDLGLSDLEKRIAMFSDALKRTGQHDVSVLLHRDVVPPHILSDSGGRITGIIDFDGAKIGDPAADFQGIWVYGPKAVAGVYRAYRGPKDDDFLRRSLCYKVHRALSSWDASYRRGMPTDFLRQRERELGRWVQKEPDQWLDEVPDD